MAGDPKVVDAQAWTAPDFRATGNNRKCSGITFRGPWGDPAWKDGGHEGLFGQGELWVRVYAPDRGTNGWGNMAKPKVYYQLADGREYAIEAAGTQRVAEPLNKRRALNNEAGAEASIDALKTGWAKQFSILRSVQGGLSNGFAINGATPEERAKYVRDLDLGVASKGETARSIGRDEPHATGGTHINYLVNNVCLGAGKVYALAGRLPTTPKTRNGEPTMTAAQARYWSITGYSTAYGLDPNFAYGAEITSVMDDEIVTNASGDYILLYGRAQDRPANATAANGVTWVDWGTESCQAFTIRWVSPGPDWTFAKAPNQTNLGWETEPASASYNPAKIGMNDRNGFLGAYQPVKSYLTKAQWEGLGSSPDPQTLPRP
jgi:hypothetical protein